MTIHYSHRIPVAYLAGVQRCDSKPACCICEEPVELETAKTDEYGRAIHEACYVLKLASHVDTGEEFVSDFRDRRAQRAVPRFRS